MSRISRIKPLTFENGFRLFKTVVIISMVVVFSAACQVSPTMRTTTDFNMQADQVHISQPAFDTKIERKRLDAKEESKKPKLERKRIE